MKKHTKVYLNHFGYTIADTILCEICNSVAVDIHHINARGMGGSKKADNIENLMALCRICHDKHGDISDKKEWLKMIHFEKLSRIKHD